MRTVWPGRQDDAESLNMGSPATLRFFLEYGIGHYPAREYALTVKPIRGLNLSRISSVIDASENTTTR